MSVFKKIKSDGFRYTGNDSFVSLIKLYFRIPGFRYMCWHRIAHQAKKRGNLWYVFPWLILSRLKYKYGYDIPAETVIGEGFYIGHFGGIVISSKAMIGKNVNISQGVTIGVEVRGGGCPVIGNCVYIAPGAKIIGDIRVGGNSAIGANAVVIKSVDDETVVGGMPAKVISHKGSHEIILNQVK